MGAAKLSLKVFHSAVIAIVIGATTVMGACGDSEPTDGPRIIEDTAPTATQRATAAPDVKTATPSPIAVEPTPTSSRPAATAPQSTGTLQPTPGPNASILDSTASPAPATPAPMVTDTPESQPTVPTQLSTSPSSVSQSILAPPCRLPFRRLRRYRYQLGISQGLNME